MQSQIHSGYLTILRLLLCMLIQKVYYIKYANDSQSNFSEAVSDRDSRSTDDDRNEEVDLSLENTQADGIFLQDEELDVNLNHQENMDEELLLDQVINSNAIPELNGNSTPELKAEKHKIQQNGKSGKSAKKSSRSRRTTESDKMSTISEESERTEMTVEEKEVCMP